MATVPPPRSQAAIWLSIVLGVSLVCAIAFASVELRRAHSAAAASGQWQPFVDAAKNFAHDRYTSTPQSADADIQRFIDETTGELHNELVASSDALKKTLRIASWSSTGTVLGTGVEELTTASAKVLVGVRVDFTARSGRAPSPHTMMLRLTVQNVDTTYKVSTAEELT